MPQNFPVTPLPYYVLLFNFYFAAGETGATLSYILTFTIGANKIPSNGLIYSPTICFWDDRRPKANSCANVLYLPSVLENYDLFQEMMDAGILNSPFFGMA